MLWFHRRSARELHIERAPTSSLATLTYLLQAFPTRAGSSKEGDAVSPLAIGNRPASFINALHFLHDGYY